MHYTYWTAPTGPPSINNAQDIEASANTCYHHLAKIHAHYDGILIACYSPHPLVSRLQDLRGGKEGEDVHDARQAVIGIMEASIVMAVRLLDARSKSREAETEERKKQRFGIVSTGKVWEDILPMAVPEDARCYFAGVETTGLSAVELHEVGSKEVKERVKDATKRLLRRDGVGVQAICLGCAGMAGMDEWVREATVEEMGAEVGSKVDIVDGVVAGVRLLEERKDGRRESP
jgi:Asp/Glu/hydantoin racemase